MDVPVAAEFGAMIAVDGRGGGHFTGSARIANNSAAIFGGQIFAQALDAAMRTADRAPHMLMGNFLRAGRSGEIDYRVDIERDGGAFSNRRVSVEQAGRSLATFSIGFHDEESGFEHDDRWRDPPPAPDGLPDLIEAASEFRHLPAGTLKALERQPLLDVRPADPARLFDADRGLPLRFWVRPRTTLADRPALWAPAIAYISDYLAAGAGATRHARFLLGPDLFGTTLNHSLWLHRIVDPGDWLFFEIESHRSGNGRTLNIGKLYDRAGATIATVAQEALLRRRREAG